MPTINEKYESLSSMMDDDGLSYEALDELLADEDAAKKWYEYHLIRDCLQHKEAVGRDANFIHDVKFSAALAEISKENKRMYELGAVKKANSAPASNHAFKVFAVAASLVAITISVWQLSYNVNMQKQDKLNSMAEKQIMEQQKNNTEIISVNDAPKSQSVSEPIIPDAAKENLPENKSAVRVEDSVKIKNSQSVVQ